MDDFASKAVQHFKEVTIQKDLVRIAGLGGRAIPTFVSEWIVSRFAQGNLVPVEAQDKIQDFINNHLPPKDQRERIKNRLYTGEQLLILDEYLVTVDLAKGDRHLQIPLLDEPKAALAEEIVDKYPLLLGTGVWGVGKLRYRFATQGRSDGRIYMSEFHPMQAATINVDLYCRLRDNFSLLEWRDLLVSSMGYNPAFYSPTQQIHLLTRLIPIVQERVNLLELAPKGTGKSFVYLNLSRYVRLVSGGKVTPAVLFYNNATRQPGLLSHFDVVVFDEAQSMSFDNPGEVVGVLKDYLESGQFSRGGKAKLSATAGLVILANIPLNAHMKPASQNLFAELPKFLGETAFIDRIHGIIPGWELPRIEESSISRTVGFKADFFGEIMHHLRTRVGYETFAEANTNLVGTNDRRDRNAIIRLASGYLKLLFPSLKVTRQEYIDFCLRPAIALRQRIRDQLTLLDPEYKRVHIAPSEEIV